MGDLIITDTDFSFEWNSTENTTPPGSADIADQAILQSVQHRNEDFYYDFADLKDEKELTAPKAVLKAFTIHHPAIMSYEIVGTGIKEEELSDLKDHISTVVTRKGLKLYASAIKVITLAGQEYTFPVQ